MFTVYGVSGRLFTGTLEQLRQSMPVGAVARQRPPQSLGRDPSPYHPADSAYGTLADDANRAYTQTQMGDLVRRPLTQVSEVMSRTVVAVPHIASVLQGWKVLAQNGVGQAPVIDENGQLIGLLLRADVLPAPDESAHAWGMRLAQPVTERMTTPVPSVAPDTDLRRVAQVMLDTGLPGLPVADPQGLVLGFISRSDILRAVVNDPPLDLWT